MKPQGFSKGYMNLVFWFLQDDFTQWYQWKPRSFTVCMYVTRSLNVGESDQLQDYLPHSKSLLHAVRASAILFCTLGRTSYLHILFYMGSGCRSQYFINKANFSRAPTIPNFRITVYVFFHKALIQYLPYWQLWVSSIPTHSGKNA